MSMGLGNPIQDAIFSRNYSFEAGQGPRTYIPLWRTGLGTVTSNIDSATATRRGEFFNTGSPFIGKVIRKVAFALRISAGTPTGTYTFTLRDNADAVQATLGSFDIATTLVGTYRWIYAEFGPQVIPSGGRLLVEFTGGDGTNRLSLLQFNTNQLDSNTQDTRFLVTYTQDATRTQPSQAFG